MSRTHSLVLPKGRRTKHGREANLLRSCHSDICVRSPPSTLSRVGLLIAQSRSSRTKHAIRFR